ncbi:MAG: hydrogenase 4 subunit B [Acetobacteraceae bacterium]|nr:hydrogenase 4 subunit B [Acetobacteraceae bacterium]
MITIALHGLVAILLGLAGLGVVGTFSKGRASFVHQGCAILCALGALLSITALLLPGAATLALPVGLPGKAMQLALDPLSLVFLLLLFVTATAAAVFALEQHAPEEARAMPFFPVFIAAMALALLAADAFTFLVGFELMSLASWATVLYRHEEDRSRSAALFYLGMASFSAACLIPAFALLGGGEPDFAAMRALPPEGWHAFLVLALVVLGAGSKAGLAPLHLWLPLAHPAAPSHISALMSGAMTKVALYVIIRVLFDLCGPAQPIWFGYPLLVMGSASAILGALRANMESDLKSVLAASTIENVGLVAIGLGLALLARGADLAPLAALALAGALLHILTHGVFKTLLFLGAGAAQHGGGSRILQRLGGLVHRMPVTTACMIAGCICLAALPPGPGFASEWLLFQAVLAAPRIGGLALQTCLTVVAALMAMAAALAATAAIRLLGVAFLGRPRTPRVAGAQEAGPAARAAMLGLVALSAVIGLFPTSALALIEPAIRQMLRTHLSGQIGVLSLHPSADAPGYTALITALLLAASGIGIFLLLRRWAVAGHRRGPAWACGFAAPPAWLPFGDPATQYGGASFAQPLRRALGTALLAAREEVDIPRPGETRAGRHSVTLRDPAEPWLFAPIGRWREKIVGIADAMQFLTIRQTLSVMFAVLILFLASIAVVETW